MAFDSIRIYLLVIVFLDDLTVNRRFSYIELVSYLKYYNLINFHVSFINFFFPVSFPALSLIVPCTLSPGAHHTVMAYFEFWLLSAVPVARLSSILLYCDHWKVGGVSMCFSTFFSPTNGKNSQYLFPQGNNLISREEGNSRETREEAHEGRMCLKRARLNLAGPCLVFPSPADACCGLG